MRIADWGMRNRLFPAVFALVLLALWSHSVWADIKIIEAEASYLMGDNDSKIAAHRIAVLAAKRKALELAGTYIETLTQVRNYQLTKDEILEYTAGILETEILAEEMRGTAERPEIYIKTRCTVDTSFLFSQIDSYRENEDLKEQLDVFTKENSALRKEQELLMAQLAAQKDRAKAEATRKKLDAVLSREESNHETTSIWTNLAYKLVDGADAGLNLKQEDLRKQAIVLQKAVTVNPQNHRAHYLLALISLRMGDQPGAEAHLRTSIHNQPSNPAPHMKLGILLRERGSYMEAMKEFHFVERLRPRNLPIVFYTGMTFKDLKKCGKAVQYLNRFLKDKRVGTYPQLKEQALVAIEQCGGERPGRQKRTKQMKNGSL